MIRMKVITTVIIIITAKIIIIITTKITIIILIIFDFELGEHFSALLKKKSKSS